jgi:hypothetical protein
MIYDRDHCGASHLVMRTSTDGLNFSDPYRVIVPQEPGIRNQNPALFRDPHDGRFHLYWYRGGAEAGFWQIKMRSADTVEGLADPSSEKVLIDAPYELAAPNMMYADGTYFLSTEVNENAWKTRIYAGPSPSGPFAPLPDAPQLRDNQACLFQHVMTTTMHGYICKDTGAGWVLNYRSADLSKGRSAQRSLDPGVWTSLQGDWHLVESDWTGAPNIVLRGKGQRAMLKTALSGSDYVFSASGRLLNNDAWGVAVRVKDADNYYLVKLVKLRRDDVVRIEKVTDGATTLLAETPVTGIDRNAWHRLTVRVFGDRIEALLDDQLAGKAIDTSSSLTSGNSALVANLGDAQFDAVIWRKFAPQEPKISVGAREDRNSVTASSQAEIESPLFAVTAALTLVIGLGIMAAGFVRNRR